MVLEILSHPFAEFPALEVVWRFRSADKDSFNMG